jgi:hypothetical protein
MTSIPTDETESALACNLNALSPGERTRHGEAAAALFAAVVEAHELPDGYGFQLPPESSTLVLAAEFVSRECRCCPFFTFIIELEPAGGPLWLRLTGPEGVKELLLAELGHLLPVATR